MDDNSTEQEILDSIWATDLLGRRDEANTIQAYVEHENSIFQKQDRQQSLVLAIDAEYGQGKSWFLDRLASQLSLKHPVARIDAWADDASEEPLTAFMASIDDALSPFLSQSKKLRDKMASAKVAALPVMGRLVKGVMVKGLSKVAGEGAEDALGDAFEGAVNNARDGEEKEAGAIANAVEGAFEEVGKEIDSLVDRRGAAMLAEYRQRKKSRAGFRKNMRELVAGIDAADVAGQTPLIVIIDELDRCRPDYAIRVLEEIKHFFDVPGVAFILAIHGDQLQASIEAVYGASFDSEHYLRRFFARRWKLRPMTMTEIIISEWNRWENEGDKFEGASIVLDGSKIFNDPAILLSYIFEVKKVSAREASAVMDVLRLMAIGWEHEAPISMLLAGPMAINFIRSEHLRKFNDLGGAEFQLPSIKAVSANGFVDAHIGYWQALETIWKFEHEPIGEIADCKPGDNPALNFASAFFDAELSKRNPVNRGDARKSWSLISTYESRLTHIDGFLDRTGRAV